MVPVENFRKSVFLFLFFNRISISRVVGSMFRMRSLMFMVKIVVFLNPCERIFIVEKTLNLAEKVDIENYLFQEQKRKQQRKMFRTLSLFIGNHNRTRAMRNLIFLFKVLSLRKTVYNLHLAKKLKASALFFSLSFNNIITTIISSTIFNEHT